MRTYKYIGTSSNRYMIEVEVTEEKILRAFEHMHGYLLPDNIIIEDCEKQSASTWKVKINQGTKRGANWNKNNIVLTYYDDETGVFQTIMDLVVLSSHLIELENIIQNNVVPLHSSAIAINEKDAILFVADGGRGKTTTSLQLAKLQGNGLISVDKTHIKNSSIVGGTKFIWFKKDSYIAQNYINNLETTAQYIVPSSNKNNLYVVPIEALKCKLSSSYPYEVKKIYFVEYDSSSKLEVKKVSKDYAKLRLYQQVIYFFYSWPGLLLANNTPLPTFGHDEAIKQKSLDIVNTLIENTELYLAKGNLEEMKLYEEKK